jgi:hypothetical protein
MVDEVDEFTAVEGDIDEKAAVSGPCPLVGKPS